MVALNPFVSNVLNWVRLTKILILIWEGILEKISYERLWVGRRKEPILSYVTKNDEKKNPGTNGLNYHLWSVFFLHKGYVVYNFNSVSFLLWFIIL